MTDAENRFETPVGLRFRAALKVAYREHRLAPLEGPATCRAVAALWRTMTSQ